MTPAPMHPVIVRSRSGTPPSGVADLSAADGTSLAGDALVAAGQALTWQAAFTCGRYTAIPLTAASAVVTGGSGEPVPEPWHERFTRGLLHRVAGELTVVSVAARLIDEAALEDEDGGAAGAEDRELLGAAVDGLSGFVAALGGASADGDPADRIVSDTLETLDTLLGGRARHELSAAERGDVTATTVISVAPDLTRDELERARSRIGLPWPSRVDGTVGDRIGLAGWREAMQANGDQIWCRLEGDDALVTELWLRNPRRPRE